MKGETGETYYACLPVPLAIACEYPQEPRPGPSKTGCLHDSYPPSIAAVGTLMGPSGPETRPVRHQHNKYTVGPTVWYPLLMRACCFL